MKKIVTWKKYIPEIQRYECRLKTVLQRSKMCAYSGMIPSAPPTRFLYSQTVSFQVYCFYWVRCYWFLNVRNCKREEAAPIAVSSFPWGDKQQRRMALHIVQSRMWGEIKWNQSCGPTTKQFSRSKPWYWIWFAL